MSEINRPQGTDRRAIPQRSTGWAAKLADAMYAAKLTPNKVSVGSVIFAVIGAAGLIVSGLVTTDAARAAWLMVTVVCIPLRLLLNMLDGMLAVEKGLHTPTGDLFNEVPDRIADLVLLAAAGYATAGIWAVGTTDWGVALGWSAAAAAILTAYVRTLGAANGVGNFFVGPMAKPARMWVLVLASLASLFEPLFDGRGLFLAIAVALILIGSLITVVMRLQRIAQALHTDKGESA
ncbi:MAG TPA: CDP-alcohol phosphatidyltransferase family protein [Candidatus Yaniella excrementavium]|nr:CDP-alcohol phosphatidyltransferase family protein [Candidatus Yaniella excrementavium]